MLMFHTYYDAGGFFDVAAPHGDAGLHLRGGTVHEGQLGQGFGVGGGEGADGVGAPVAKAGAGKDGDGVGAEGAEVGQDFLFGAFADGVDQGDGDDADPLCPYVLSVEAVE